MQKGIKEEIKKNRKNWKQNYENIELLHFKCYMH